MSMRKLLRAIRNEFEGFTLIEFAVCLTLLMVVVIAVLTAWHPWRE